MIAGLIGYQIVCLRKGRVMPATAAPWPDAMLPTEYDFVALRRMGTWYAKRYGHLFVLLMLKLWIKSVYWVKRKKEILMPKIKVLIFRNKPGQKRAPGPVSNFLKSLSDYKNKLRHLSDQIKEEEQNGHN